jgi:uncharacterized membrane protein
MSSMIQMRPMRPITPMSRIDRDDGSTIPLVLGIVIVAVLMVAASIAAGDAFQQQRDLQGVCDGAAAAAASAADFAANRTSPQQATTSLLLADVQPAVSSYLDRDPGRSAISARARVVDDPSGQAVAVVCTERTRIAFGSLFGLTDGIRHTATATARSPLIAP